MWWTDVIGGHENRCDGQTWRTDVMDRRYRQTWRTDVTDSHDGQMWQTDVTDRFDGQMWQKDMTDRRHGQMWQTDMTDRRDGQTWRTDMTDRRDGQMWRSDVMDRRDGQTWWTDVMEERGHGRWEVYCPVTGLEVWPGGSRGRRGRGRGGEQEHWAIYQTHFENMIDYFAFITSLLTPCPALLSNKKRIVCRRSA